MMKKFPVIILLLVSYYHASAQNVDSLVYDQQRKKVNALLDERGQRFGQYYESLEKRSGIFNIQTKKDLRRSNDILVEIVQADNEILKQTKTLVDYRVNAEKEIKQQSQFLSVESNDRISGYISTIGKLRSQIKERQAEIEQHKKTVRTLQISIVGIVLFLVAALFILYQRSEKKRHES